MRGRKNFPYMSNSQIKNQEKNKFGMLVAWRCAKCKDGVGYCIMFIKSLDEGLRLQFLGKTLDFTLVIRFKLVAKS